MESHQIFFKPLFSTRLLMTLLLLLVCELCEVAHCQQHCPEECTCLHPFISCDGFTEDTLRAIPEDVQTLILIRGTIRSFPPAFFQRFPDLSFLEIQFTEVEAIASETFSGLRGLDYLAIMESRVGDIETGAFRGMENVSLVLISHSQIRRVQPRAFSAISNVGELSIRASSIEEVKPSAFEDLSDIGSFTFSLNNVSTLAKRAFQNVRTFGKVDISQNNFDGFQASAMLPLMEASSKVNVSSNTVLCQCSSVQAFRRPQMVQFLQSQTCTMPETGEIFKLSEVNVTELCLNQPSTSPSTTTRETSSATPSRTTSFQIHTRTTTSSMTQTYPTPDVTYRSSTLHPTTQQPSPSEEDGSEDAEATKSSVSSTFSHGAASNSTPATVSRFPDVNSSSDVTASKIEPISRPDERNRNNEVSENSSKVQNGTVSGTQTSLVSFLAPFIIAWLVSLQKCQQ